MKRRNFLIGVGSTGFAGLAGCLSSPNLTSTAKTDSSLQRRVSLASQDSVPEEHELEITVDLLEDNITDDHTAKLLFRATNEGSDRKISLGRGQCHPFNRSRGASDEPEGLWLYTEDDADDLDRNGDKWQADKSPDRARVSGNFACIPLPYQSDESIEIKYEVWDNYAASGYLDPGTYQWNKHITIEDNDSEEQVEWSFSLEVSDPNR